jgi:hypothetical protein
MDMGLAVLFAISLLVAGVFGWFVVAPDIRERLGRDGPLPWYKVLIRVPGYALWGMLQREGKMVTDGLGGRQGSAQRGKHQRG